MQPSQHGDERRGDEPTRLPDERPPHPDVEFERAEPSLFGIVAVLIGFAAMFGIAGLVAWWYVAVYEPPWDGRARASHYAMPAEPLPPEPRLEPLNEAEGIVASDIRARHLVFERLLNSYGAADEEGYVRIPIEKAIELAVEQLPVAGAAADTEKSYGLLDGGESNSGRVFLEAPSWFRESE
jgi:hypothetical protein